MPLCEVGQVRGGEDVGKLAHVPGCKTLRLKKVQAHLKVYTLDYQVFM